MKKLLIVCSLLIFINSYSQEITKANNALYLDLGLILTGNSLALGMGLNYERMLNDNFSLRGGVNVGFFGTYVIGDKISGTNIGFPITINYMTKNKNKFEVGLGGGPQINLDGENGVQFFPALRLGYRYQPDEGGMMFRAGLEIPANLYLSVIGVGYIFK